MMRYAITLFAVLLLAGCAGLRPDSDQALSTHVETAQPRQWVEFGLLQEVEVRHVQEQSGGQSRLVEMMGLVIQLDSGQVITLSQPTEHAGELTPGSRVRVLRIGGFSQVTYWPYEKLQQQRPSRGGYY